MGIVKVWLHSKMCGTIAPSNNNDNCGTFAEESNLLPKRALIVTQMSTCWAEKFMYVEL